MSRPSRLTRTLRSLTALVTVWCLGCGAFDPLIASLLPESAGPMMVCASEASVTGGSLQDSGGPAVSVSAIVDQGNRGASCDCGTCHAPAPTALASASPPSPMPQRPAPEPSLPPGDERAPLVPPPQHGA